MIGKINMMRDIFISYIFFRKLFSFIINLEFYNGGVMKCMVIYFIR